MKVSPRFGNAIRRVTGDGLRSLKTDFQNATVRSDEPSGFRSGESYRPEARHIGQCEPGVAFVRSPCCASVIGGDHNCAPEIVSRAATSATHIAQAENRAGYRRRIRKDPGSAAVARYRVLASRFGP